MNFLVDTNVISEVRKPHGNPAVRGKVAAIDSDRLFLSVITIGEVAKGIEKLPPGDPRRNLEAWLAQTEQMFADRVLPIDRDVAALWGEITAKAAKSGRVLPVSDGLIAATAIRHGLRLMTRNVADFLPAGVIVVNPWDGPSAPRAPP